MSLEKLHEFLLLERNRCPWAVTQTSKDIINEIRSELLELEEELQKNPKDNFDLAEEFADVFSDVLLLLHIAERDHQIIDKEDIINRAYQKKIRRKGWILEGKRLTRSEASSYWYSAKGKENTQRNTN